MLKTIFLLSPVYVTLFWSIVLNSNSTENNIPRKFLGKFMAVAFVVYLSHFLFFMPFPDVYVYIDPIYQFASLLVYPLYYIYIRLLTVDEKFSMKKHLHFLLAPSVLFVLYTLGIFFAPEREYRTWLFDRTNPLDLSIFKYLNVLNVIIKVVFVSQIIMSLTGNFRLIKKYALKAGQYYSNMENARAGKVNLQNFAMVVTAFSSFVLGILGRKFFVNDLTGLGIASVVFSSMLFFVGWLGNLQFSLNPTYELSDEIADSRNDDNFFVTEDVLSEKLQVLFEQKKIYLNNRVNILDVAQELGTNRSYLSSLINQRFGQNFCSFVNGYRIEELKNVVREHPEYTNQQLVESCGFGSIDSLKRAIFSKAGMTLSAWRKEIPVYNK